MQEIKSSKRPGWTMQIFDNFDEADQFTKQEAFALPEREKMILLEQLRAQFYPDAYPDASPATQKLQRVFRAYNPA